MPLVLTQVPRQTKLRAKPLRSELIRHDWFNEARVILLGTNGQVRVLSEGFSSACDPSVSFDGSKILFAARKQETAPWRIWEVSIDGTGRRPITPEHINARSPIYATTLFTLDSPEPWFTTVFVGSESWINEAGRLGASSLYNIRLDGTELRRMTFNPNRNFDPFQTWDGRILYCAERYANEARIMPGRTRLYSIHVEGADMELYGGELGKAVQQMPCITPGGLVVFIESNEGSWDGAGQLSCLEEKRPHVTYRQLTKGASERFLYPSPLRENIVLVSRRSGNGRGTCGVFRFDVDKGLCEIIFDSPEYDDVQAVAVRPRRSPDGHSTVVDTKAETGIIYGLNCYDADSRMASHLRKGSIKRVRFLEGVPQPAQTGTKFARITTGPVPRRLVGEAPVEEDGSFNVEVPADTPLLLQTVDEHGMALGTCGWIWVKPKEKRGCIGCHEDPERTPENEYVLALRRPSNQLVLAPEQRRSISFQVDIAPILQKHCATAKCHGGRQARLLLPLSAEKPSPKEIEAAYAALTRPESKGTKGTDGLPRPGKYIDAGRSRTSWLAWQLMGTNTSRAWDKLEDRRQSRPAVTSIPPHGRALALPQDEIRCILQWIDLGAPYAPVQVTQPDASQPVSPP